MKTLKSLTPEQLAKWRRNRERIAEDELAVLASELLVLLKENAR